MEQPATILPSVAVIIPTYNRWPHVSEAIDSSLAQSHTNVEVVVVDDASTDETPVKVRARFGDRVKLIVMPDNVEKSRARNEGILATDAEFVCMLDSDDVLHEDGITDRLKIFLDDPSFDGVAYGSARYAKKNNTLSHAAHPSGEILDRYLDNFMILNNNAYLLRRSVMQAYGMYRENLTNTEDRELLIRLTARLPFRYCNSVIQTIRRVDHSASSCFEDVVRQGPALTKGLKEDDWLVERLGERMRDIEFMERYELVRAQYKLRQYRSFAAAAKELSSLFPERIRRDARFRRRLMVARVFKNFESAR